MRKINYLFAMAVLALSMTLAGCIKSGGGVTPTPKPTSGVVDMSTVEVRLEDGVDADTENYEVVIKDASNNVVASGKLGDLTSENLSAGDYNITVSSMTEAPVAEWEAPYYVASGTFSVEAGATTSVGALTAQLKNIGVEVIFTDKFKEKAGSDCKVVVVLGLGKLTYTIGESRMGYFRSTADNMALTAELTGTFDGKAIKEQRIIKNIKAGDRKQITYDVKEEPITPPTPGPGDGPDVPPVEPPVEPEEGDAELDFKVDVSVNDVDVDGNIIVDENDGENEDGDGPEVPPVTPPEDKPTDLGAPTIVWEGHNLDEWFDLTDGSIKVALNISAPNKIKTLVVDIVSNASAFQPDQLQGVGLDSHLDLSNPGDLREAIEGLGFPVAENVVGKTELVFDISEFMPLMVVAEDKDVEFVLTLTDEFGHELEKSLKLKVNLN